MANETIFKRYEGNPIIKPEDVAGANSIFNSAVVKFGKGYAGVFRVDTTRLFSELHTGFSEDAINWEINEKQIDMKGDTSENYKTASCYDPRVVEIDGTYYTTWCYYPAGISCHIGIAKTRDFKKFTQITQIMLPYNRNAVLFPSKVNGKFACLNRPSDPFHTTFGEVFYCESEDLIHWGNHKFVFGATSGWQRSKVGPGPAPIRIKEGWLLIYHGVRITCSGYIYCMGGAILDGNKPWKTLYRCKEYLLAPATPYEMIGDVPNVVFPTALLHDKKTNKISVYYGCADTVVGLATADMGELVRFIKKNS
ncbi:MAG: hypothetical protein A2452_13265 [Candidatus Firestonebacteria bacterium RIFOXYC2_FULL_39_67]|nr:MAG: hypothetical protein A2536_01125 [Candidatus Firestonebacteria bacterium RIFOXYD2_FULL_39_29]OGF53193.1 MAG: hypothetical protein A2497_01805 [Candidatus Firestonebacteria bacterium RifOxyC12_full_39_7]OGF56289.1 MAG: hypothetical protein A2452_13265 [Candidatus Firestonebacteria bacterium RIFOXYC2_FULL_39_67]